MDPELIFWLIAAAYLLFQFAKRKPQPEDPTQHPNDPAGREVTGGETLTAPTSFREALRQISEALNEASTPRLPEAQLPEVSHAPPPRQAPSEAPSRKKPSKPILSRRERLNQPPPLAQQTTPAVPKPRPVPTTRLERQSPRRTPPVAAAQETTPKPPSTPSLGERLSDDLSSSRLRDAIILTEVLGPPTARRPPRRPWGSDS